MSTRYDDLIKNIKLRNKLLNLGIGCSTTGPKGDKGDKGDIGPTGPTGPAPISTNESLLFMSFNETKESEQLVGENIWLIPNPSDYFVILNEKEIKVQPGIYEITFSGFIDKVDNNHGATLYLQTSTGSAIKDLTFELLAGNGIQMHFSQSIVFRFEEITILQVMTDITGDSISSNVVISDVNLIMKKIHE